MRADSNCGPQLTGQQLDSRVVRGSRRGQLPQPTGSLGSTAGLRGREDAHAAATRNHGFLTPVWAGSRSPQMKELRLKEVNFPAAQGGKGVCKRQIYVMNLVSIPWSMLSPP